MTERPDGARTFSWVIIVFYKACLFLVTGAEYLSFGQANVHDGGVGGNHLNSERPDAG